MEENLNSKNSENSSAAESSIKKKEYLGGKLYCAICNIEVTSDGESSMWACPIHGWMAIVFSKQGSE